MQPSEFEIQTHISAFPLAVPLYHVTSQSTLTVAALWQQARSTTLCLGVQAVPHVAALAAIYHSGACVARAWIIHCRYVSSLFDLLCACAC